MKDILTIIFRLTVACLLAGAIMGGAFVLTNQAKRHNAELNERQVMLSLLGYASVKSAPASLKLYPIYRYLITAKGGEEIGYLLPGEAGEAGMTLVILDLDGKFVGQRPVTLSPEAAKEETKRAAAIPAALGGDAKARYADQTIVVTEGGQRLAYLLPGRFPGFKTFITAMLALNQDFSIRGLEIMESEEDPGLGGEIVQKYFKNQFKAKTLEAMRKIGVVKTPLPDEYRRALEADGGTGSGGLSAEQVAKIEAEYSGKDIYALTGATISSRSVTEGVRAMVQKFVYRLGLLDQALKEQKIAVPF
ncbi:MAG: FMN-binding protein [Desulfobacteraceae bacterium]|nr:FMN-binding protein [Desulfobacteraceae bacterium]